MKVPTLVLRRPHQAASDRPLWGPSPLPHHSSSAQKLARQHLKAPDVIGRPPNWSKAVCAQEGVQVGFGNEVETG